MPTIRDQVMNIQTALRAYRAAADGAGDPLNAEKIQALGDLTIANSEMLLQLGYEVEQLLTHTAATPAFESPAPAPEPAEPEPPAPMEASVQEVQSSTGVF